MELKLPLVLHIREHPYDNSSARRRMMTHRNCVPIHHPIMWHCYTDDENVCQELLLQFPNLMFSLSAKLCQKVLIKWHDSCHHDDLSTVPDDWMFMDCPLSRMVDELDLNRILLETDSPYLPPPGFEKPGHPWQIAEVAKFVARRHNIPIRVVLEITRRNAVNFFNLSPMHVIS